jgi:hypothetical protein
MSAVGRTAAGHRPPLTGRHRSKGVGGNFSVERPVHPWKRSFAKHDPKAEPDDSGRSRGATANKDNFEGERLHLEVAN